MSAARCHAPSLSPPIASQRPVGKKIETQSLQKLPEGSSSKQLRTSCFDSWIRHSLNQSAKCTCRRSQHTVYQASQSCSWQRSNRRSLETLMRGNTYYHQLKQRPARQGMQSAYARSAAASLPAAGAAQGMVVEFNPLHGQAMLGLPAGCDLREELLAGSDTTTARCTAPNCANAASSACAAARASTAGLCVTRCKASQCWHPVLLLVTNFHELPMQCPRKLCTCGCACMNRFQSPWRGCQSPQRVWPSSMPAAVLIRNASVMKGQQDT